MMNVMSASMLAHGCCMVMAAMKMAVSTSLKAVMELGIFTVSEGSVHKV